MHALIGAALLAAGRPVTAAELASVLQVPTAEAAALAAGYATALNGADLGFRVEVVAGGYRLVVPPELTSRLAPLLAPPPLPALSSAALEVLAVIAYRQPVTRAEIEGMRGGSAGTIVTLQERELVKVVGRSDAVGRPLLYGTTEKFLLEFGLASLAELPPLGEGEFSHLLRG
ncbi:SMC-Scp complex subunit ScpB [Deinococcus maricopensis]|uniref:Chromosome segregation and condensation protein, ScpB n=1 Tax=Deinococcus maricopensis (strain DSM 21211 / LMG 22137 / NRRL B-23946 / LB-34) TaxID=709986 RepID=E8U6Y8_DEIML|nr:SMC-Scp complex subunit ScpB [Deinococcus maricopensis]ADV66827.1 chromosome segregation and condensation protein, ScpB [Deinococcus maricopensis DSM 21211]